ncbi:DUF1822 family protein [Plectonema cf. radiosum LEGE 06105]|uniref:DUF1822 family protein n=1 Tax=Plectonema cf. radiosum LEGE 06105 TaxID=945769 RepID=A0A8J7FB99_9CYAN|nr:DUF1822 family protein [Plectonema radiosum]MBE9213008.1 DUF1822 family protein [Plectonema cf. radiosum LEGE 06105]
MNNNIDDLFDFSENIETIELEPEQCEKALQISQDMRIEGKQWQVYLQALALFAFAEWLEKREPSLTIYHTIQQQISSILKPEHVSLINAVYNLQIGDFKVCLIPIISFSEDEVTIPRAVVDIAEFNNHFYIVIAVEEELEIAAIKGFISYQDLIKDKSQFQLDKDWTYQLSLTLFNHEVDELLMYLQCYSPSTIPLPAVPNNRQNLLAQMQRQLVNLLPQLNNRQLWEVLTWEEGVAVLTNPELVKWLYDNSTKNSQISALHLSDFIKMITQQAVNIQRWLDNQIDDVMQAFSWQMSPIRGQLSNALPSPMRESSNLSQQLGDILTEIRRNLEIPNIANYFHQDIVLEVPLRVYAVIWSLPDDEWTLLVVLKVLSRNQRPYSLNLRISDQNEILVEEQLQPDTYHDYIFAQVIGNYADKFLVTLTSSNGEVKTFNPFVFVSE